MQHTAVSLESDIPPVRTIRDIEAIERVPLEERVWSWNLNDWIARGWSLAPDKFALQYVEDGDPRREPVSISYRELAKRSTQAANLFHFLGAGHEDGILFLTPTLPQLYYALLGGLATGIACVVNWMQKPEHLVDLVRSARTRVLVVLGPTPGYDIWENVQKIRAQLPAGLHVLSVQALGGTRLAQTDFDALCAKQPGERTVFERTVVADDVAAYVHSGGTTGSPKLVRLTHRGICYKAWVQAALRGGEREDSIFADYPLFHVAGLLSRGIFSIASGMTVVIPSALGARDRRFIANYWKFVERYRITHFTGVPTTLAVLAKNLPTTEDVSSLKKTATTGSAPLPVETVRELERGLGIRVLLTYGSTEYTTSATQPPREGDPRYGSTGFRLPYTRVETVELDRDGNIARVCGPDEPGIVVVKGPGVTPGYVDPKHNAGVFTSDGYFKSGDLGRIDADGYLWITGRVKDLIIRGGHNIDPMTIEDTLKKHPAVLHAAAVGRPDAYAGELPVAYVQRVPGASASEGELAAFALAHIPERPAAPKEIYFVEALPLTDIGKPDKVNLRFDAARRAFTEVLAAALGARAQLAVEVGPDATHGTRVTVAVSGMAAGCRLDIERRIAGVMKGYSYHYVLRFG
ncbi:MAG: acyl-CoA synthetase [Burkholderiales bacterium]|nr:acyl-CoA synthetase [Burkholderiales bacterium]